VPGGVLGIAGVVLAGALGHAWIRRDGRATPKHAVAVGLGAFVANGLSFVVLGEHGLALLGRTWPHFLVADVIGITLLARLFQDVRERESLAVAQRRFRAIIDDASDAIRIVDTATSRIVDANRMDCTLSGVAREELIGRDSREFWPAPAAGDGPDASPAHAFGVPFRTRDGRVRSVDTTRRTVEYDGRRYEILTFHDAAEREAAEAAHREVAELRAVTMLASAAAHEINNPLTVIVGFLQLQRNKSPDGEDGRWMERVLGAAERIREIIVRMNRITKLEAARSYGSVPAMLDLGKSSEPADAARRPDPAPPTEDA
jgi:PAS domain S-box-containing protein